MFNIFGILILLLGIFVILRVFDSSAPKGEKILWLAIIILLPMIGMIAWFFVGPGDKSFSLKF